MQLEAKTKTKTKNTKQTKPHTHTQIQTKKKQTKTKYWLLLRTVEYSYSIHHLVIGIITVNEIIANFFLALGWSTFSLGLIFLSAVENDDGVTVMHGQFSKSNKQWQCLDKLCYLVYYGLYGTLFWIQYTRLQVRCMTECGLKS